MRYSPWRHARQWWTGWRGRHFRWLCFRYAQAGVAVAWLFLVALLPLAGLYAAAIVAVLFTSLKALASDTDWTWQGTASQHGAVLIARAVLGFRGVAARTWYETNRPSLPSPTDGTYYVNLDAGSNGDGSEGNPWNTLTSMNAAATSGKLFYIRGTSNGGSIQPAGTGTSTDWLVFKVWPGYTCTITGNATYDAIWLSQNAKEYVWIEGFDLDTYANGNANWSVAHSNATARGPVVVMDCTCVGGVQVISSTGSWIEGCTVRKWGGRALPHGPTTAIAVALAGVGAGNVTDGAHKYRVRFKVPYSDSLVTSTTDYSPVGQYFEGSTTTASYTSTTSASVTTSAGNGQVDLSDIPVCGHADCTEKELYRLVVGGTESTIADWKLLATISNATTTYRDNIADGSLGAALTNTQGNQGTGISILNSSHNTVVYDNTVNQCGHGAIEIAFAGSYSGDRSADVRLAFNTVTNEWSGGMATAQSDDAIVEGNIIRRTARIMDDGDRHVGTPQGLIISGIRTIARYNRISETWGQGLVVQSQLTSQSLQGKDCQVVFNTVHDCYGAGLLFYASGDLECSGNLIANNIFWGNCLGGMTEQYETYGYYNGAIYDIWVYSSLLSGTALTDWYASGNSSIGVNNLIVNNIISTSPEAMVHVRPAGKGGTQALTLTQAQVTEYPTQVYGNLSSDPLLRSTDYTSPIYCAIPTNSPAVNAGYNPGGYTYVGSAPDIGVYEVA